jgi:hypothetical protein
MTVRFVRALPLALAAGLVSYGLLIGAGALGVLILAVVAVLAGLLAYWARRADPATRGVMGRTAINALLCVPALLVVFFSFSSGGFFPDSVAIGALAVAGLFLIRLGVAARPLRTFGPGALVVLVGLFGLAGWALLSQLWSHAPGRATVAFDRDLLYALTFALFASVGRTRVRLAWALRGVVFAMTFVAAMALLSRVAPSLLPTTPVPQTDGRLAYPLTYWNALGVFCAVAAVLCLHLAASDTRRDVRVASTAALPVIGVTLLLTYSRGGLGAAAIGLIMYAILGRPRGLISALIAAGPATAIAMKVAYDQTLLSSAQPTVPAAVHQGHHLALVVLACVVLAIVLRTLLLPLDRLFEGERSPIDRHQKALRGFALGVAAAAIVAALVLGAPAAIANRWDQFVDQQAPAPALLRDRLSSTSNDGRIPLWKVAMDTFDAHPLDGTGADTYEIAWFEDRPNQGLFVNAHSLYIETLSDLGLVGLACVLLFVLGTLVGLAPLRRGRDRAVYAVLFGAGVAWALHAGVDWDWQMPAVSLWFAALGGLALGRPDWRAGSAMTAAATVRVFIVAAAVVAVAVAPSLVLGSQVRLNEATAAYASGNCVRADHFARGSLEILGTRAEPWQIEALCAVRDDQFRRAEADLRAGLAVDPNDWELQSALAAATAAAGSDARAEAASARRLDPNDPRIAALAHAVAAGPSARSRRAGRAFLSQQTLIAFG